ncbi:MAG: bifunctional ornithine acetyltransferase/N-acetylglutamate synthase [Clostridia bacterium]|nr:bifunctional ornithine acetyltransferase/N-acetylglutamate synthase [Erysipelotrichia bacterium]NCC87920.1 bifunctional ornithine acetyltransferase/N-acetylglutamate synthase [Clostridia bacterium]
MFTQIENGVCAPKGFKANGIHCGIRKNKSKKDLALIYSEVMCQAASIYTLNKVKGAPIAITKKHLEDGKAQAIIVNSGNANTCNADGEFIAKQMSQLCADALHLKSEDIIIASTGVIGQPLAIEPIATHMEKLADGLNEYGSNDAVCGMMTTDTFAKQCAISFMLDGKQCKVGGIAKGSGMIHPNMATMLAFITSDVKISSPLLQQLIKEVGDDTFNMVSVDGDTSTNDMLSIMCNGLADNTEIIEQNEHYQIFKQAVYMVCETLSKMLASDGEGATKLLTCQVVHARSIKDAKAVAKSIITSSLFKAAMFGNDANWGRILCAIGYADANFKENQIDVSLASENGTIEVCKNSQGVKTSQEESGIDEEKALAILKAKEVKILVDLKDGDYHATAWGCDLTYDYVKINGDYRT